MFTLNVLIVQSLMLYVCFGCWCCCSAWILCCGAEKNTIHNWDFWVGVDFDLDDNFEGCLDEMRDVIGVDELFEGLFSAKVGSICSRRVGCRGSARRAIVVQRQWTALEWWILYGCSPGQQLAWGPEPDWVGQFELVRDWPLWYLYWCLWRARWAWDIALCQWSPISASQE